MSEVENTVLTVLHELEKVGSVHVGDLFDRLYAERVRFTDTEIVSAIWSLTDRGLVSVADDGTLALVELAVSA